MKHRKGNFRIFEGYSHYLPSFGGLVAMLLWLLVGAALGSVLVGVMGAFLGQQAIADYGTLLSYPLMFIPPMLFAKIKSRNASYNSAGLSLDNDAHFSPLGAAVAALLAMTVTIASGFWCEPLTFLLPQMPEWLEQTMKSLVNGNFWLNFLCVSLFAPFFEEWLCRGMVMRGLLGNGVRPLWSIVISAAFFALIHLNPWQAIPAFVFGCIFGYVYYRTGSLKLTMLMHFTNNTLSLVFGHIDYTKDMESWRDIVPSPLYWVLIAASILLTLLCIRAFGRIRVEEKGNNFKVVDSLFSE